MTSQGAHSDGEVFLSVVAPAFNEAGNIRPLVAEVAAACETVGRPWEFVVVNDASTDETLSVLREQMAERPRLRVVCLSRRSGQTAALEAGLRHARGRYIATLDADLQNPPGEIPRMLERIVSGQCDMVNAWRKERHDPALRLISTGLFNRFRNRLTSETIHDSACGLKVYRREVAERFKLFTGMHRFLPTLARMNGFRVMEIPVSHRPRTAGVAKYGVWNRVFKALVDTLAVRWMQRRNLRYEAKEIPRER